MNSNKSILVAMSGGTDSSTACIMLQNQGYNLFGVTMRMWDSPSKFRKYNSELPDYIIDAQELAKQLNFPHYVLDLREEFKNCVVKDFVSQYAHGKTPNPCVECNKHIKFKKLLDFADELGCPTVATGHYAKIVEDSGVYFIEQGDDRNKDQSYFLWQLGQDVLSRLLFPLGDLTKDQVREYATEKGRGDVAKIKESQDICFIETDYRQFLEEHTDLKNVVGDFVDINGNILGKHKGCANYTIGQRKGLQIALGRPMYVVNIDPSTNQVTLGDPQDLLQQTLEAHTAVIPNVDLLTPDTVIKARIRYRSTPIEAVVEVINKEERTFKINFTTPVSSITPGQSVVLYDENNRVLAGAKIK